MSCRGRRYPPLKKSSSPICTAVRSHKDHSGMASYGITVHVNHTLRFYRRCATASMGTRGHTHIMRRVSYHAKGSNVRNKPI